MDKILIYLFETILQRFEELAAKTENKIDDALVATVRSAFEQYKASK
jgi:hypothetical protein